MYYIFDFDNTLVNKHSSQDHLRLVANVFNIIVSEVSSKIVILSFNAKSIIRKHFSQIGEENLVDNITILDYENIYGTEKYTKAAAFADFIKYKENKNPEETEFLFLDDLDEHLNLRDWITSGFNNFCLVKVMQRLLFQEGFQYEIQFDSNPDMKAMEYILSLTARVD
eukprot:m.17006 g.17006  ORF g.17006 m.17006 type:complete len:168 (-) comp5866_c0_seq1:132-635(-)